MKRRDYLKAAGSATVSTGVLTATSGVASADTITTEFRSYISGNLDYSIESDIKSAIDDAWDGQLGSDFDHNDVYEDIIDESEIEKYVEEYLNDGEDNRPIVEGWLDWMDANGEWINEKGVIHLFTVDISSGKWADWENGDTGTSAGQWHGTGHSWAVIPVSSEDDKGNYNRRAMHEIGHICMDNTYDEHGIGDYYKDELDYNSETVMYHDPDSCGSAKSGELPYDWIYGDATVEEIEYYLRYDIAYC